MKKKNECTRLMCLLLALILSFAFAGCETNEPENTTTAPVETTTAPETTAPDAEPTEPGTTCPICNAQNVTWIPVSEAAGIYDSGHFYLTNDIQGDNKNTFTIEAGWTVCLNLNNCDITNLSEVDGPAALKSEGILRVTGDGTVKSNGSGVKWAPIYADNGGTLEIYGGTYVTEVEGRVAVKAQADEGNTVIIYGGSFSSQPDASFIPEGYEVIENAGVWTVAKKAA